MRSVALVFAAALGAGAPAHAADLAAPAQEPAPPPVVSLGPTFQLNAYFWAASVNGKTATLPPLPATKIELKFKDSLKDFNGGIQASTELRYDRWGLLTDFMYSKLNPGGTLPGPYFSSANVTSQSLTIQGDVLYRFYTDQTVDFDLGAGLRYWNLDNELEIKPGILNRRILHSESEDWIDPVIAARIITRFNDRWSFSLLGDIGGFDVGSKLTYQFLGRDPTTRSRSSSAFPLPRSRREQNHPPDRPILGNIVQAFVERTFGWMTRWRRLVRDYEKRIDASQAMILIAMGGDLLRRNAHP